MVRGYCFWGSVSGVGGCSKILSEAYFRNSDQGLRAVELGASAAARSRYAATGGMQRSTMLVGLVRLVGGGLGQREGGDWMEEEECITRSNT